MAIGKGTPDLFVLTGYPGTLVAIATNYIGEALNENTAPPLLDGPENPSPEETPPPADEEVFYTGKPRIDPQILEALSKYPRLNPAIVEYLKNTGAGQAGPEPCNGFGVEVKETHVSADGGYNFGKLPAIVLGGPEAPNTSGGKKGTAPTNTGVVSLGSGGSIVLDMGECELVDGFGADLTVFENPFFSATAETPLDKFPDIAIDQPEKVVVWSEAAKVGVSSDGINFKYFPCDFDMAKTGSYFDKLQSGCAGITPTLYGKDPFTPGLENGSGGDSFDLADIGVKKARYVKIVSGGAFIPLQEGQAPENGVQGFDLDAVAVVNGEKL